MRSCSYYSKVYEGTTKGAISFIEEVIVTAKLMSFTKLEQFILFDIFPAHEYFCGM
jgi:hypothetical protein